MTLVAVRPFIHHEPPDVVGSSGLEAVEFAETCGIALDDWQSWSVHQCLAEKAGGGWASFENAIITPRQNGKNYILRVIQLACLFLFDDKVLLHSAHQWDTVNVHRQWLMSLLESHDEFATLLKPVDRRTGRSKSFVNINGDEQIQLTNGRSSGTDRAIVFKTRSAGKTRGFTGDKVFLDEAQKLGAGSMGDTVPTLSTSPGAQLYYTGSAPNRTSRVLHSVISRAQADDPNDRLFVAVWGNDPGVLDLEQGSDEQVEAIRNANPAVGAGRITEDYVRQEIRTFSGDPDLVEEHTRERMGVATDIDDSTGDAPIDLNSWDLLGIPDSMAEEGTIRLCLDVSPDRKWSTFGIAGWRPDKFGHVAVRDRRPGTDWVITRGKELAAGHDTAVIIVSNSPAKGFIALFEAEGVKVDVMKPAEYAAACDRFIDAATGEAPIIRHRGDPNLRLALASVQMKSDGDGGQVFSRVKTAAEITPLSSVTAAWGRLHQPVATVYTGSVHDLADYLDS